MDFYFADAAACDRSYMGRIQHGYITSPNYPFNYTNGLNCTYSILFPDLSLTGSKKICFKTRHFSLENSAPYCLFDYLKVGSYKYCAAGLWQYGLYDPKDSYSSIWSPDICWSLKQAQFDIIFVTDNATTSSGFYIEYDIVEEVQTRPRDSDEAPCNTTQWTCFNRKCIDQRWKCDGKNDCDDASDETYIYARCPGKQTISACSFSKETSSNLPCGLTLNGLTLVTENITYQGVSSHLRTESLLSRIDAPQMNLLGNQYCFSFLYFSHGPHPMTSLSVYFNQMNRSEYVENISISTENSSHWRNVRINLVDDDTHTFKLSIETRIKDLNSWLAYQDFSLIDGICNDGKLSCNYASSLCGWMNLNESSTSNNLWSFMRETNSNQGYAHLISSPALSTAALVSPQFSLKPRTGKVVIDYFLRLVNTSETCFLNVSLLLFDGLAREVWSRNDQKSNTWESAEAAITADENDSSFNLYQIVIKGTGRNCNIFLKRIVYTPDSFYSPADFLIPNVPTSSSSSSSSSWTHTTSSTVSRPQTDISGACEFLCRDRKSCISKELACDGVDDCEDASDEIHCSNTFPDGVASSTPCHNCSSKQTSGLLLSEGGIVGIVLGCISVILLILLAVCLRRLINRNKSSDRKRSESTQSILSQVFKFSLNPKPPSSNKPPLPSAADLQQCTGVTPAPVPPGMNDTNFSTVGTRRTQTNASLVASDTDILEFSHAYPTATGTQQSVGHLSRARTVEHVYEEPQYFSYFLREEDEASPSSSFSYVSKSNNHDLMVREDTVSLELFGPREIKRPDTSTPVPDLDNHHRHQFRPHQLASLSTISNSTAFDVNLLPGSRRPRTAVKGLGNPSIDPKHYLLSNNRSYFNNNNHQTAVAQRDELSNDSSLQATCV